MQFIIKFLLASLVILLTIIYIPLIILFGACFAVFILPLILTLPLIVFLSYFIK